MASEFDFNETVVQELEADTWTRFHRVVDVHVGSKLYMYHSNITQVWAEYKGTHAM